MTDGRPVPVSFEAADLARRILARDTTVWPQPNVAATRLGWTDIASRLRSEVDEVQHWAAGVSARHIVLIGMGGSSLGPEVLRAAVGSDRLVVLDTTDPATVAAAPLDDTVFVVSSKSGGTLEVRSLLAHVWTAVPDGSRYVAVTDPGTELEGIARARGFARTFVNDPDIGGRYSVLSWFGLVPAALLGIDLGALLDRALAVDTTEAVRFGLDIAAAAAAGRDKLTVEVPERFAAFGLWVEQLVAESTGKRGVGVVPVPVTVPESGPDRHHVVAAIDDVLDLGAEFLRWELATAACGAAMGIDPFDEPNVSESKANTARVLDSLPLPDLGGTDAGAVLGWLAGQVRPGDYVSIQAYLPYGSERALEQLRRRVRDHLGGAAVTAGYGPRFLHSTGQLHKGGADNVVAVQLVPARATASLPVPGTAYDFATLLGAQAAGDLECLREHGRRAIRVAVDPGAADPFAPIR